MSRFFTGWLLIGLLALSCSDGDTEARQYENALQAASEDAGFVPVIPKFVPQQLPTTPEFVDFSADPHPVIVMMWLSDQKYDDGESMYSLLIEERPTLGCPPCASDPPEMDHIETSWGLAAVDTQVFEEAATEVLYVNVNEVSITLHLTWPIDSPEDTEALAEARNAAIGIVESLEPFQSERTGATSAG